MHTDADRWHEMSPEEISAVEAERSRMDQAGGKTEALASGAHMTTAAARVAKEIRRRRSELRLSQAALARRSAVSLATVGALERARPRTYTGPTLAAVDVALGWEVGHVQSMFDEGPQPIADATLAGPDEALGLLAEYRDALDALRLVPSWSGEWLAAGEALSEQQRALVLAVIREVRR